MRGGCPVFSTTATGALNGAQLATCEQMAVTAARALELRNTVAIELSPPSHRSQPSIRWVRPRLTPTHALSEVTIQSRKMRSSRQAAAAPTASGARIEATGSRPARISPAIRASIVRRTGSATSWNALSHSSSSGE
jgi:hypothetical protein